MYQISLTNAAYDGFLEFVGCGAGRRGVGAAGGGGINIFLVAKTGKFVDTFTWNPKCYFNFSQVTTTTTRDAFDCSNLVMILSIRFYIFCGIFIINCTSGSLVHDMVNPSLYHKIDHDPKGTKCLGGIQTQATTKSNSHLQ